MRSQTKKTDLNDGLGALGADIPTVRRYLTDLGWSEARLAKEASLSQKMVNFFLNGKKQLSPAATGRVIAALQVGYLAKKAADKVWQAARLSPEAAARIRTEAAASLDEPNPVADGLAKRLQTAYNNLQVEREHGAALEKERDDLRRELLEAKEELLEAYRRIAALEKR